MLQVVGKSVSEALAQMAFNPSRRAPALTRAITRAVNAARGPTGLAIGAFKVLQAWTGKHTESPRIRYHSKGRAGRGTKRTSKLWVKVKAMTPVEATKLNRWTVAPSAATMAALDPRAY
jgi:ribosomal protein L22